MAASWLGKHGVGNGLEPYILGGLQQYLFAVLEVLPDILGGDGGVAVTSVNYHGLLCASVAFRKSVAASQSGRIWSRWRV